jgi:fructan beta-fructosidase
MKKMVLILFAFLISLSIIACNNKTTTSQITTPNTTTLSTTTTTITTSTILQARYVAIFDFDALNDIEIELDDMVGEIVFLAGENIADGDYAIEGMNLTIKRDFLIGLSYGVSQIIVQTTEEYFAIDLVLEDELRSFKIVNGGFETGDLFGWEAITIFKNETQIQSFVDQGVIPNGTMFSFEVPYAGDGQFVYGMDDRDGIQKDQWNERIGILRSSIFELGGSGYIRFKLGGGRNSDLVYISIRNAETNIEVARYGNPMFNSTDYLMNPEQYFEGNLVDYFADLSDHLGENLFIELCDYGGRDWDLMTADSFITFLDTIPEDGIEAIDIQPVFNQFFAPNMVPNGYFSDQLNHWTPSSISGWQNIGFTEQAFRTDLGILKSDAFGYESRGMIRSSLFRIDGVGVISMELGQANGPRFDKDTYVSIREFGTNLELFRFANIRSDGSNLVKYYLDLSDHLGKTCYIEIVDNARTQNDVILVDNIITYYATMPVFDFGQMGINLNH